MTFLTELRAGHERFGLCWSILESNDVGPIQKVEIIKIDLL